MDPNDRSGSHRDEGASLIDEQIDWESFLTRHDLVWDETPESYFTAPFIGNGMLGAMFYTPSVEEPLQPKIPIGRRDVVEHRDTDEPSLLANGRLPIGQFSLTMNYEFKEATGRLNLFNAEIDFEIVTTDDKQVALRAVVLRKHDVIMVDLESPPELEHQWKFEPQVSIVPGLSFIDPDKTAKHINPLPTRSEVDGVNVCVQKRDSGGSYTTAWKEIEAGGNVDRLLIAIEDSYPGNESTEQAIERIRALAEPESIDQELAAHRSWWNNYYQKSFISVPHAKLESLYWIQLYKMASMMRKGAPVPGNLGPWFRDTRVPGIWWNMDTQTLYSSLHISNQLELASTLGDYINERTDALIASIPAKYRSDSAGLARSTGPALKDSIDTWPRSGPPERSNLTYLCYYLWEHYRARMDDEYLRTELFPILRRSINYMLHVVREDEDGIIHTPRSHSPESVSDVDTNYDLASLRWGLRTLLKINERLELGDPLQDEWQHVLDNLAPYPEDENGFKLSRNHAARPMKHWSHLFQIYPYYLVNWEQSEHREVIKRSIETWASREQGKTWVQTGISSLYASIGNGDKALMHLEVALASPYVEQSSYGGKIFPNTMHAEKGTKALGRERWNPCSSVHGATGRSLQDMLLQSWGGKIRIFPAVPAEWNDLVFHNLCAEGAFEVSAKQQNGQVVWVSIKSKAGEPCIVAPGFDGEFQIEGATMEQITAGVYELDLAEGDSAVLYGPQAAGFEVSPLQRSKEARNPYGMK